MSKISQYNASTTLHDQDLFDKSNTENGGTSYDESQKVTWAQLKTAFLALFNGAIKGVLNVTASSYTVASADANKLIFRDNASANTITLPNHASDPIPILSTFTIAWKGVGRPEILFEEVSLGVPQTVVGVKDGSDDYKIELQGGSVFLVKTGVNEWYIAGNLML